jgi:hypothetical protein
MATEMLEVEMVVVSVSMVVMVSGAAKSIKDAKCQTTK